MIQAIFELLWQYRSLAGLIPLLLFLALIVSREYHRCGVCGKTLKNQFSNSRFFQCPSGHYEFFRGHGSPQLSFKVDGKPYTVRQDGQPTQHSLESVRDACREYREKLGLRGTET